MSSTETIFILVLFLLILPGGLVAAVIAWRRSVEAHQKTRARLAALEERFRPVVDLDRECERLMETSLLEAQKLKESKIRETRQIDDLKAAYAQKKIIYDRLVHEIAIFDDRLAFAELGVYQPHFDFSDSEAYKQAIQTAFDKQKRLIDSKRAVVCPVQWQVEGSTAKGEAMTNRGIRLTLRAFNNECDAAIANTRWNNVNAMEKRIVRAFEQINRLNESTKIEITRAYLDLKLEELFLTHEYREKQKAEREERAELARAQREEQKLARDMERAEDEESRYQRLLNRARAEAERAVGPKLDAFNQQIQILENDLAEARAKLERAQALAEKTRSGYVYIISNIGSFGDGVVKIGLTRRLDPEDRIRELGDASVPFLFDTHAIIYSDDAPALERALHSEFEAVRVNAQNYRKEFFRASLDAVETAVRRLAPAASFFRDIEAQEYRETLARRHARFAGTSPAEAPALPNAI